MKRKQLFFSLLMLSPLFILVSAWIYRLGFSNQTYAAHERFAKQYTRDWLLKDYTSLTPGSNFQDALTKIPIEYKVSIDANGKEALLAELQSFFDAYNKGTYAAYMNFRRPPGQAFHWLSNATLRLNDHFLHPQSFGSEVILDKWFANYESNNISVYTNASLDEQFVKYLKDYSDDAFYKDYWEAVALKDARIVVEEYQRNPSPLWEYPFYEKAKYKGYSVEATFPNLGYASQRSLSFFEFDDTMEEILKRERSLTCANCFFFVRCTKPDTVLPVLVRFYWDGTTRRWLPDDVVLANIRKFHSRVPVF